VLQVPITREFLFSLSAIFIFSSMLKTVRKQTE
jgi:hypothetical protein